MHGSMDLDIATNFLELGDKIAIPLEHVSIDTLKKILDIYVEEEDDDKAMKEISRIVYEELKAKGFEFKIEEASKSVYRVTVTTRDRKKGVTSISKWYSSIYYCCEYAPLAKTFYNYAKLHEMI